MPKRPGNMAVVHHIVLFAVPPGRNLADSAEASGALQMIAGYAAGMYPWHYPQGSALKVEAGSMLVIQMYYTRNGT